MSDCPFCEYAGPSPMLFEGVETFIIEPLNPVTPGHELVIPYEHITRSPWEPDAVARVFAAATMRGLVAGFDFNLILSVGEAATQTIEHLHVHLVPRHEGDGLHLPWTGQVIS